MRVRELIKAIETRYPLSRAESWDRVGLQIGDADSEISRVVVAREVTPAVLDETRAGDALVVYHPLLFRPLENLDFSNHISRLAAHCIIREVNLIAVHTALDNATPPHALGDHLAQELGLTDVQVLKPSGSESLWKIVVFVPDESLVKVSEALWKAGAGNIGQYERASFRMHGQGTFRPLEGANPYEGQVGRDETVDEWRLEVIVTERQRNNAVAAMIKAHPYEEVAYDVYPLYNNIEPFGAARMGTIEPQTLAEYAQKVGESLQAPNVRLVRGGSSEIRHVACVPGSGASYITAAARAGCDCMVTGDIKHHDALQAHGLGLSLIDVTHAATERATISMMAGVLANTGIETVCSQVQTNPFL
jgi:dinuclear metal center YbgI/SA1388 family protein